MIQMIQEVYPDIFLNIIPLPNNPLKSLNSYIIRSDNKNLIIDTGFNSHKCKVAFMNGVNEAGIDLSKTDLLLTHMHPDHCGLAADLVKDVVKVNIGEIDGELLRNWKRSFKEGYELSAKLYDLEYVDMHVSSEEEPEKYALSLLNEGDELIVGNYSFEIIDIPGHTPGHIGLYERKHKLFFCGDHILSPITPNITCWGLDQDILGTYLNSLEKVSLLEIDYLFTGHRSIIRNCKERIDQLLTHHNERLEETIKIIQNGQMSVRKTAEKMRWDLSSHWDEFNDMQKWLAAGEVMAHLEHLLTVGLAERTLKDGTLLYKSIN